MYDAEYTYGATAQSISLRRSTTFFFCKRSTNSHHPTPTKGHTTYSGDAMIHASHELSVALSSVAAPGNPASCPTGPREKYFHCCIRPSIHSSTIHRSTTNAACAWCALQSLLAPLTETQARATHEGLADKAQQLTRRHSTQKAYQHQPTSIAW